MQAEQMPAASSMGSAPALGAGAARARTCVGLASSESEGDEERRELALALELSLTGVISATSCMLPDSTEAAAARRWRRLAAGCLRYAAWRPWAAERSAASALALAAPRAAARENLLMATMEGRIAIRNLLYETVELSLIHI